MDNTISKNNTKKDSHGANASAATAYELTPGGAAECASGGALVPPPLGSQQLAHATHVEHEHRKRKSLSHFRNHPPYAPQQLAHASHTDNRHNDNYYYNDNNRHFKRDSVSHFPSHQPLDLQPQVNTSYADDDYRKKKENYHLSSSGEEYEMSGCEATMPSSLVPRAMPSHSSAVRKRKPSSYGTASTYEDDGTDDSRSTRTGPDKKQNHSEIEKRRRDKMNTYIAELSSLIPMCGAMSRKLDKLTVLRMAVQHLKSVRGALTACPLSAKPRPEFLPERELNSLILQMAEDCFLLVVGCDRGRLLYVSTSVKNMLHYEQSELVGQSLFDILHPKDVAKVKEQLSSSDLSPRERLIDIKTMLPVKADVVAGASRFCPGARRSFICRIKCKATADQGESSNVTVKEETEATTKLRKKQSHEKKYCVVQCTGYLKSWAPADVSEAGPSTSTEGVEDSEASNMSCLVAVARVLPEMPAQEPCTAPAVPTRPVQYVSRHTIDGKFLFVDQRVFVALGFLPQELLGTSLYEYVSGPELAAVARTHKQALLHSTPMHTPVYMFRRKNGTLARIQTHFKPFKNPWTKDVECLVANNTLITDSPMSTEQDTAQTSYDVYKQNQPETVLSAPSDFTGVSEEMQRLIESQVESHKIGSAIAEEALRRSSTEFSPDMSSDLLQDAVYNQSGCYSNRKPLKVDAAIAEETLRKSSAEYSPGLPADLLQDAVFNQSGCYSNRKPLKVDAAIAEETLRKSSAEYSPGLPADLLQDAVFNQGSMDNLLGVDLGYGTQVRNNVPLSSVGAASTPPPAEASDTGVASGAPPPVSPPLPPLGLDGNGEAAMAVIMSLLEADAGLGGPVNFSGLPWPLP